MQPINVLTSTAALLDRSNIDTDQIIRKQFLRRIERTGYGEFLATLHLGTAQRSST
jgi:3-isopropylmalate/(R)-2-methylmalate dehydratase small subunit